MIRGAFFVCCFMLAATPAFAQQATRPPIDWTKPVVGVDGNILQIQDESTPHAVEVYTLDELKTAGSPSVEEFRKSLTQPAQPGDPLKQAGEVCCTPPQPGSPLTPEMREKLNRYAPKAKQE